MKELKTAGLERRDGQNMLGKLWMEVRAALLRLATPPAGGRDK